MSRRFVADYRDVPVKEIDAGYLYEERRRIAYGDERFDRLKFAMRALRILRPRGMKVAVYEARFDVRVEQGRDFARGADAKASWAMVGIPPHASREHIALALAELAGVSRVPFVIDVLLSAADLGAA